MPLMHRTLFGGLSIHIADEDLEKLRQYQGERMLLLPNHPTGEEPVVLFEIATRMNNEVFNFVAAREVFDWEHGFRGWLLRRVGAYSVIRGSVDRDSFLMSKKILMEGLHRLVIFIEGEISRVNETLIPFEPGVLQLACWAQETLIKDAMKAAKLARNPVEPTVPPIYLAPIAIKYFYQPGYEKSIKEALADLETATGLASDPTLDSYQRVRRIGEKILLVQETLHKIEALPGVSVTDRVMVIKNRMLKKIELFLDLKPAPDATTLNRLREIRNTMDALIHSYDDPDEFTPYEHRMLEHLRETMREFYLDLDRIVYFLTYTEAYLQENRTPERLIEVLRRLEREVYGEAKLTYPRQAVVKVGEIINLKDQYENYEKNKKEWVKTMALNLESDMMQMISTMRRP